MPVSITSMASSPAASKTIIDTNFTNLKTQVDANTSSITTLNGQVNSYAYPSLMTVSDFDTETSTGTTNPNGRTMVKLSDGLYECYWNGSSWDYYMGRIKCTRPPTTGWTWLNQSTSTSTTSHGGITITQPSSATQYIASLVRTKPTVPYTLDALLIPSVIDTSYQNVGIMFTDRTLINNLCVNYSKNITNDKWGSGGTSFSGQYQSAAMSYFTSIPGVFLRIKETSSLKQYAFSVDGFTWISLSDQGNTDFVTATDIGFGVKAQGSTVCAATLASWKTY